MTMLPSHVRAMADKHGGWLSIPTALYYALLVQHTGDLELIAIIAGLPAVFLVLLSLYPTNATHE